MCEVGRLLTPWSKYRTRGNNFLRKRTNVFTSSKIFHQAFDARLCPGKHQHFPIAGKIYHLGRWISLSEYAARYSTGFGKYVARYLSCGIRHKPLVWEELSVEDVSTAFVQAVINRKREAVTQDALEEPQPDAKRQKYGSKQPPRGPFGCAHGDFWSGIFRQLDTKVPRVGKRVFTEGEEIAEVQRGVPGMKVRRVEVCRGTERFRVPDVKVDRTEIPLRVTVVKDRHTGRAEVLGPVEKWTQLPKGQQTRKGKPAKVSITIFGDHVALNSGGNLGKERDDVVEFDCANPPQEEIPHGDVVPESELPEPVASNKVPHGVAQHGPGFRELTGEERGYLRRLHHNLGHPAPERLAKFLKERHADPKFIRGILDFQCDGCSESKRGCESSRPAVIHESLEFNQVVGLDTAVWTSGNGVQYMFTHIIDEGTLFHVGSHVSHTNVETQLKVFERNWLLWAGPPQTVYVDPASEFRSEEWMDKMQSIDAHVKTTVGAAHWQLGRVEIHGAIVKKMLDKMDAEKPIQSTEEFETCLTHAFNAKNCLSRIKGYSPEQAVLGVSRRLPGSLTSDSHAGSLAMAEGEGSASESFRLSLERRCSARKTFIDADNSSSLRRALLRRNRPLRGPYETGDLVLYWRKKGANLKRERGRWYGPASVVAVEGTRNVWLNHGGRLVRACPEQIRPASFREWKHAKELVPSSEVSSISRFSQNLKGGGFIDLEEDGIPEEEQDDEYEPSILEPEGEKSAGLPSGAESLEGEEKPLSPREMPVPDDTESEELQPHEIPIPESESDDVGNDGDDPLLFGDDVVFAVEETSWDLWEVEIPLEQAQEVPVLCASTADESVLLVSDTKKRKVEVKLSTLKSQDQLRMAVAKHKEIGAWLKHSTVRKVSKGKIPESSIMRCRWILSWKSASPTDHPDDVQDGRKGKARLVVVGFEDPGVGVVQNDSPTLSKDGRQMVIQQVSSHGWDLVSFDISTAFLHGDGDGRLLGLHPTPELAESLGMGEEDQCQLVGGAYGRVDAPYLWFCKFRDTMLQEGYHQCPMDPCVFTLTSKEKDGKVRVRGSLGVHVDDGIGGGDNVFMKSLERIRKKFSFGSFEKGSFTFTGIRVQQWDDKSIEYDQIDYIEKISPLEIPRRRRDQMESQITPEETTQLRSLIGALQYASVHTRPDLSAKIGELQSSVPKATVRDLVQANKVLHEAKVHKVSLMTVPIAPDQVSFCAFSDASFLSGKEKYAHQGGLIFATTPELLENKKSVVAPIAWISKKIQRVTRSTLGAEAIALSGTVDRLLWIRLIWEWLNNPEVDWKCPEEALKKARRAALVTDCKSAYDLLTKAAIPQCEEHRTTIECLLIRERLQSNCMVRWVTSNAQLADCLTKSMDGSVLRECLRSGRYALFDEGRILQQRSDKKQRIKWAKEVTTDSVANTATDIKDTWEVDGHGQVIRIHHVPRRKMFSPIGVPDCPVDIRELGVQRITVAVSSSGKSWNERDFWPGTRGHAATSESWTGKTVFQCKGSVKLPQFSQGVSTGSNSDAAVNS